MSAAVGDRDDEQSLQPSRWPEDFSGGAVDRLVRVAYGLGVPARFLSHPFGRAPRLRLLATVENPLPGSRVAGTALRAGHFLVLGTSLACDAVDYGDAAALPAWAADALHGFAWLADLAATGPIEATAPVAERLLRDWMAAHPHAPRRPARRGGWTIARTAERLLAWLIHAPLILSTADRAAHARVLATIAAHARWLDRHARRAPDTMAAARAWAALAAAGLLLPAGRPRELRAEAALLRALGELVGDDGGVLSRCPIGQAEAIALLVRLCACYRACRRTPPGEITAMLSLLVPPLATLVHGDGGLGSWQGGWAIDRERIEPLIAASGSQRRAVQDGGQWGYRRLVARQAVLQVDVAPPPLPRHARHGCAGTLAFEFSVRGRRVVVNCGGAAAVGGLVPIALEQGLRATAAHSTLTLDDANSSAILHGGRIGRGVSTVDVERGMVPATPSARGATCIDAGHDGYAARYGLRHRRILSLSDDGNELTGEDRLEPSGRQGRRRRVGLAIRFHLGPDVGCFLVSAAEGCGEAHLVLPDGSSWRFVASAGVLSVDDSVWVDGAGAPVGIRQLVLSDVVGRAGGAFAWRFSLIE